MGTTPLIALSQGLQDLPESTGMSVQVAPETGVAFRAAISRHRLRPILMAQALPERSCRTLPGPAPSWPWARRVSTIKIGFDL